MQPLQSQQLPYQLAAQHPVPHQQLPLPIGDLPSPPHTPHAMPLQPQQLPQVAQFKPAPTIQPQPPSGPDPFLNQFHPSAQQLHEVRANAHSRNTSPPPQAPPRPIQPIGIPNMNEMSALLSQVGSDSGSLGVLFQELQHKPELVNQMISLLQQTNGQKPNIQQLEKNKVQQEQDLQQQLLHRPDLLNQIVNVLAQEVEQLTRTLTSQPVPSNQQSSNPLPQQMASFHNQQEQYLNPPFQMTQQPMQQLPLNVVPVQNQHQHQPSSQPMQMHQSLPFPQQPQLYNQPPFVPNVQIQQPALLQQQQLYHPTQPPSFAPQSHHNPPLMQYNGQAASSNGTSIETTPMQPQQQQYQFASPSEQLKELVSEMETTTRSKQNRQRGNRDSSNSGSNNNNRNRENKNRDKASGVASQQQQQAQNKKRQYFQYKDLDKVDDDLAFYFGESPEEQEEGEIGSKDRGQSSQQQKKQKQKQKQNNRERAWWEPVDK